MRRFAELLDRLSLEGSRLAKLRLLGAYFRAAADPDRGFALAALVGELDFEGAKPRGIWELCARRVDPELLGWSYDYVGDLAETTALIWPSRGGGEAPPLWEVVAELSAADREAALARIEGWLDRLDATGRWALIKLVGGNLRVGVSAGLAKVALAELGQKAPEELEEVWYAVTPPYAELFAWLEGRGPRPDPSARPTFRSPMLAHPLDPRELAAMDPADWIAEWKWDGIRVQLAGAAGQVRLFSRSGEDISRAFPELLAPIDATIDGELLIVRGGEVAPFSDLQRRLNRKVVGPALLKEAPAHLRAYDLLFEAGEDLRGLPFAERRRRLELWYQRKRRPRIDLSPLVPIGTWEDLDQKRAGFEGPVEGVMLKRAGSPYLAGRVRGGWWKWKRDPLLVDAVLMYAQRGSGKRSSYYSDYTFGVWTEGGDLVPVGKAYFGFTDDELKRLDGWIRAHTVQRFGPVREVQKELVLEVAFEGLQRSSRHKAGVAMRFPRIRRIRWDKRAAEADQLATVFELLELLEGGG